MFLRAVDALAEVLLDVKEERFVMGCGEAIVVSGLGSEGDVEKSTGGWSLLATPLLNFHRLILARGKPAPNTPKPPH